MAEKYFERIPRGKKTPPDVVTLEVKQLAEKRMNAEADTNPQVDIHWHTVPFGHKDSYALEMSRRRFCPRARAGFTRIWCWAAGWRRAVDAGQGSQKWAGYFDASGEAKEGHKPEEVEQGIYDEH